MTHITCNYTILKAILVFSIIPLPHFIFLMKKQLLTHGISHKYLPKQVFISKYKRISALFLYLFV